MDVRNHGQLFQTFGPRQNGITNKLTQVPTEDNRELKHREHFFTTGVFGADFSLKLRAYHSDGRKQGKKAQKLILKSSVVNKLLIVKLVTHTARTWSNSQY